MVIWLTGISGSGKTTIASSLLDIIKPHLSNVLLIDGDIIRELFGGGLGFDENARKIQIIRIQKLTKFLSDQDMIVIVAALYSSPDLMIWNRKNLQDYFEVYVNTPLETVIKRDTKGLYRQALAGELSNVIGIDLPWHTPVSPDLAVLTHVDSPVSIAWNIINSSSLAGKINSS